MFVTTIIVLVLYIIILCISYIFISYILRHLKTNFKVKKDISLEEGRDNSCMFRSLI